MNSQLNATTQKHYSLPITILSSVFTCALAFIFTSTLSINNAYAAISATYAATPATSAAAGTTTPPLVMLVMSNDHQLFTKAYTDYNDIIDATVSPAVAGTDGILETTYTDSFDYYGYFDSNRCYTFGSGTFSPATNTGNGSFNHDCGNSQWSGNFLNWTSMTKMDVIRKVLYGGYRSTDNAGTVLERAYIPKDAHAFVKTYSAPDAATMRKYTPFNTTSISLCNVSHASSGSSSGTLGQATPPSLRVADGTWGRWATSEVAQCEWSDDTGANNSLANLPTSGGANDELGTFTVRVSVCVSGREEANCTNYTDGSGTVTKKPTGLLQDYGSDDNMLFGLISGSYIENNSGGVLRKNISSMQDEINADNGQILTTQGIINTINAFRIVDYDTGTKRYADCDSPGILVNTFLTDTTAGKQCKNWGNPLGEMYLEAVRYFAGETTASADFAANDSTLINTTNGFDIDLAPVAWSDPLSATNYCAECNIIVISSGLNSFDMDELSSASDIPGLSGAADVRVKTNILNTTESITGNYFIGENGTDTNGACTAKSLSNLGDAEGICPEEPFAKGGYGIAGIANHALFTDLRTDNVTFPESQVVNTYGVALSRGLPTFTIPTSGTSITIMPICQSNTDGAAAAGDAGWRQCSLINLQVINPVYNVSNEIVSGILRVHYEDSHWGNDYDMDGVEDLSFCVGASCPTPVAANQVTVNVTSPTAAAGYSLRFGYTIGGTTADGEKFPLLRSGGDNYNSISPGTDAARDCSQAPLSNISACTETFTAGASGVKTLESPLWYAAKWGGFVDANANGLPDLTLEWDRIINATEASGSDGIPDNYFQSDNPAVLESQLSSIFRKLQNRTSSGSAAAVITDTISTVGSVYQALYQPKKEVLNVEVSWIGQIHSIFIDAYGHLREDTNENKTLDSSDEYVLVKYSPDFGRTQIWYCSPTTAEQTSGEPFPDATCPLTERREISEFKPVWNANNELATFSATDARLTNQRDYTTAFTDSSAGGRHILTWQDLDADNVIDNGEILPFIASNFTNVNGSGDPIKAGLLDINTGTAANDLTEIAGVVNYIRGYEDPATTGYRSRTIDFLPAAGDEVWRMGDIINSSPVAVGPPNGNAYGAEIIGWDTFGDSTYTTFKQYYQDRRTVLYAGGNDGLVHAFNAGFYNVADQQYCLDLACVNSTTASHTLGAEIWAYAPRNLLPQLKFLTEPNYPHVYYVDGGPRTFDVNIFPVDTDHPGGWGTILVIGMELGGGANSPITVTPDADDPATTFVTGSAYVIFDVTNPEIAPKVLGEFIHPDLGFTTSHPTLLVKRSPDENNNWAAAGTGAYPNDFRLVFGSGPNKLSTGLSDQNAKLFMLKLVMSGDVLDLSSTNQKIYTTAANSFVGDPIAKNWNNDFLFDAVYFGIAGGTEAAPDGGLMRIALNTNDDANWAISDMLDSGQPFLNMPVAKTIENPNTEVRENWVFAGTGRLLTINDNTSTTQQSFYGLREDADATYPNSPASKVFSTTFTDANYVQNVTGIRVFRYGDIIVPTDWTGELTMNTFAPLELLIDTKAGWYRNFTIPPATNSSERNLSRATLYSGLVVFPSYTPNTNTCLAEGNSAIYAVYDRTGTGYPGGSFVDETLYFPGDTTNWESLPSVDYGFGLVSDITLKKNADGTVTPVCTTSTGEICNFAPPTPPPCLNCEADTGRQSWREILLF